MRYIPQTKGKGGKKRDMRGEEWGKKKDGKGS